MTKNVFPTKSQKVTWPARACHFFQKKTCEKWSMSKVAYGFPKGLKEVFTKVFWSFHCTWSHLRTFLWVTWKNWIDLVQKSSVNPSVFFLQKMKCGTPLTKAKFRGKWGMHIKWSKITVELPKGLKEVLKKFYCHIIVHYHIWQLFVYHIRK